MQTQTEIKRSSPQLFVFSVPGLPEISLAVMLPEVASVAKLEHLTPVPLAPRYIIGVSPWRGEVLAVVDMVAVLCDDQVALPGRASESSHLIVQVTVDDQCELVAWPILPGAHAVAVPAQAPQEELPDGLSAAMAHVTFTLSGRPITLLHLAF